MTHLGTGAQPGPVFVFGEPMVELSSVTDDTARLGVGGDSFNTAVYLARAGVDVQYVTAIGDDPMSARVLQALSKEGVGTDFVTVLTGKPVGLYAISLDDHGERTFTYWRSASAFRDWFSCDQLDRAMGAMERACLLYFSGITLSVFTPCERERIRQLAADVQSNGHAVAFDTNYRPSGWRRREDAQSAIDQIMPHVSIALPTFEDEADLFGVRTPEACVARWRAAGVAEVCVKSGPRGALLSTGGWVAPQRPLKPVDTTGAGDSFNGAYLAARLHGAASAEAAMKANALAGRVIMSNGAIIPEDSAR